MGKKKSPLSTSCKIYLDKIALIPLFFSEKSLAICPHYHFSALPVQFQRYDTKLFNNTKQTISFSSQFSISQLITLQSITIPTAKCRTLSYAEKC